MLFSRSHLNGESEYHQDSSNPLITVQHYPQRGTLEVRLAEEGNRHTGRMLTPSEAGAMLEITRKGTRGCEEASRNKIMFGYEIVGLRLM